MDIIHNWYFKTKRICPRKIVVAWMPMELDLRGQHSDPHCRYRLNRNENVKKEKIKQSEREGEFDHAKTKYGIDDIRMKRTDTSKVTIIFILIALNIFKLARVYYCFISRVLLGIKPSETRKLALNFISFDGVMEIDLKVKPGYQFADIGA